MPPTTIKVPVVIGENFCQVLVVTEIPLDPPALTIKDIDKEVKVTNCKVIQDKVIVNGILHKNINYKTLDECKRTDEHEMEDRHHLKDDFHLVCGDVRHCSVDIPFHCFVEVPGAEEDMDCQIEAAFVEGEKDELICPTKKDTFKVLKEKAIVRVDVKVTETRQLCVNATEGACPDDNC